MEKKQENDNNQNIVKYRRRFHINIGIVVFAFVLIYFLVYLFQYLTDSNVSIYEVQKGQIMVSSRYTGLVLREETVTYSGESGKINYYSKEGEKAGYGDLICSIDSEGSISEEITAAGMDGTTLDMSDLLEVRSMITEYANDYSGDQFYNVYSFGQNLNSEVQENLYLAALDRLGSRTNTRSFSLITADRDGVLAFYTDGYEGVTPDNFTANMFSTSDYKKTNLNGSTSVSYGQPLYKTVTDENWYMLIPVGEDAVNMYRAQMEEGEDTFLILVTFKKDDAQAYATAEIRSYNDQDFLLLSFNSSMIRYVSDRYLEVELGSSEDTGLKIPNSAITQKEFYEVPEDYIADKDSSTPGVILLSEEQPSGGEGAFVAADIYYIDPDSGNYCIAGDFSSGDMIRSPDGSSRYVLSNVTEHEGVYNVNKGYAVFKLIDPISSNGEYTIVETGTGFGLSLYDRIALNGDDIEDGAFIN